MILFVFISVCLTSYVKCGVIDSAIYGAIKGIVDVRYRNKSADERQCIAETLNNDRYKDKSYADDLIYAHAKLEKDLEESFENAATKCEWIAFVKTPLGICIVIGIVLMLISMICGLIKCICC